MSNYKRLFIEGYKYIFLTIVTYNRQDLLLKNIDLLRKSFLYAKSKYVFNIFACIVLKDHLHCILIVKNEKDYPEIVRLIKYYFSVHIDKRLSLPISKAKKGEKGSWQRSSWDHSIRNEKDLYMHLDYIHYNCFKHYKIAPKSWEFSSFQKFVSKCYYDENWFNIEDKNNVLEKDFE